MLSPSCLPDKKVYTTLKIRNKLSKCVANRYLHFSPALFCYNPYWKLSKGKYFIQVHCIKPTNALASELPRGHMRDYITNSEILDYEHLDEAQIHDSSMLNEADKSTGLLTSTGIARRDESIDTATSFCCNMEALGAGPRKLISWMTLKEGNLRLISKFSYKISKESSNNRKLPPGSLNALYSDFWMKLCMMNWKRIGKTPMWKPMRPWLENT